MLIYEITILNIASINFIMFVNIKSGDCFNYCRCQLGTIGLILVCPHLITPIINQLNKQKRQRVY
jgi:hypothetical protein